MQEKIIAGLGILLALVCSIIGWWMENGPERKKPDESREENDQSKAPKQTTPKQTTPKQTGRKE